MENITSSEEIMVDATQENVYVANSNINLERIRKICRESDFAKLYSMQEQKGGYLSNFNVVLNPTLKDGLGMTDIRDEEVYLVCFVSLPIFTGKFIGGFAVTEFGAFSSYAGADTLYRSHISFENLAKAQTIDEGFPSYVQEKDLEPCRALRHWLMADNQQVAFFSYAKYGKEPIINLFREIASSVRRDLGIGRVNILQVPQA